jgi:hypothetical protein
VGSALGAGNYPQREAITRAISGGNYSYASRAREGSAAKYAREDQAGGREMKHRKGASAWPRGHHFPRV